MVEKYEPYLIGVKHIEEAAQRVVTHVLHLNVKSVGVEISEDLYSKLPLEDSITKFWIAVIKSLNRNKIEVVYLVPDQFFEKIYQEAKRLGHASAVRTLNSQEVKGMFAALSKDTLTRIMEKKVLKEKPEAIVVGTGHAMLMRKDLRIPKQKFRLIGLPNELRYLVTQIKEIRRFQIARRKARKQRLEEIRKRKEAEAKKAKRKRRK